MDFSDAVTTCLKDKYVTFSGRASRSEYWWFVLFNVAIGVVFYVLMLIVGGATLITAGISGGFDASSDTVPAGLMSFGIGIIIIYAIFVLIWLAMLLPNISVFVRRLHDRNMTGWLALVAIVLQLIPILNFVVWIVFIIICALPGTEGPNKYGDDPLGGGADVF